MTPKTACFLYVTVGNHINATQIAHALIGEKLAACANLMPPSIAIYEWGDDTQEEEELVMIVKTTTTKAQAASEKIMQLHEYETPCIAKLEVDIMNEDYFNWLEGQVET